MEANNILYTSTCIADDCGNVPVRKIRSTCLLRKQIDYILLNWWIFYDNGWNEISF